MGWIHFLKIIHKRVIYELSMFSRDYLFPKGHATIFFIFIKLYIFVYKKFNLCITFWNMSTFIM